jgi:hypothetical protein
MNAEGSAVAEKAAVGDARTASLVAVAVLGCIIHLNWIRERLSDVSDQIAWRIQQFGLVWDALVFCWKTTLFLLHSCTVFGLRDKDCFRGEGGWPPRTPMDSPLSASFPLEIETDNRLVDITVYYISTICLNQTRDLLSSVVSLY